MKELQECPCANLVHCSWGSWDSGKGVWLVWGHVNGGMEASTTLTAPDPTVPFCLPLLHAAAAASPFSMASPQMCGPSFLPFFSLSSLPCMCVLRWMVLVLLCFWLKTHFLCVCVSASAQLSDTSLPCLLIELSIPSYSEHQYTCCLFQWSEGVKPAKDR